MPKEKPFSGDPEVRKRKDEARGKLVDMIMGSRQEPEPRQKEAEAGDEGVSTSAEGAKNEKTSSEFEKARKAGAARKYFESIKRDSRKISANQLGEMLQNIPDDLREEAESFIEDYWEKKKAEFDELASVIESNK